MTLKEGSGKSENMVNSGHKSPIKGCSVMNPVGFACSKRSVQNLDDRPKSQKYAQGIIQNGDARGHTAVLDNGSQ